MRSKKPQIQLYADECFPVTSVTYLKSLGISIVHAYDKKYIQKNDHAHLELSKKLQRVLITLDRDFNEYEQVSLKGYPGVIIISVSSVTVLHVNQVIKKALKNLSSNFVKGALVKITNTKIVKIKEGIQTEKFI